MRALTRGERVESTIQPEQGDLSQVRALLTVMEKLSVRGVIRVS